MSADLDMKGVKRFISSFKKPWRAVFLGILILVVILLVVQKNGNGAPELVQVTRGTVTQEVIATGQIVPEKDVSLAFQTAGTIARVYVQVGDKVDVGTLLLSLDDAEFRAQLAEANAAVDSAEANLGLLKQGAKAEDVRVSEAQVAEAEGTLISAKRGVMSAIQSAVADADDAIYNRADQLFTNATTNPQLVFSSSDTQLSGDVQSERLQVQGMLVPWEASVRGLTDQNDLHLAIGTASDVLGNVQQTLSDLTLALSKAATNSSYPQSTIDGWKTSIATARTNVSAAIAGIASARGTLVAAEAGLSVSQNQLALKKAPATPEEIAAQEAGVGQAQAKVALIQAQMDKMTLRSPLKGVVTRQDGKIGQSVFSTTGLTSLVSIIGENSLEIETNTPEIDVAKLQTGNVVRFTLDALPGENFTGRIISIDPAETVIDGVSNYKVKIAFDAMDPRFKSGLTANLEIETVKKENVLLLPQYAIVENASGTFIRRLEGKKEIEVPVTLGIRGRDGNVEVISGLKEGDKVLNVGSKPKN